MSIPIPQQPCSALLGVVFVVQRPSTEPEVVFQHPPPLVTLNNAYATEQGGDLDARLSWDVFGIDSKYFAKLMLPHQQLCNWGFDFEIDAGYTIFVAISS